MKRLNVAIIGTRFMGKAHSNAWKQAPYFFDLDARPVLKVACGAHEASLKEFAARWGWEETETDWRRVVARDDVDIVDICTPTYLHHDMAVAAAEAGKHVFLEKPMAMSCAQARCMYQAAEAAGVVHYLNHNYRRCPAVLLAKRLIDEGEIGRILHWRGAYLQAGGLDPNRPLTWRMRKETAGSGPHHDLNSHSVDLARFLAGEIKSVSCMTARFIPERPLPPEEAGAAGSGAERTAMGEVTVEDAAFMLAEFENGALGSFETTRCAAGRRNYNSFEIYGSKGSILFDLERMNELEFYSGEDPEHARGFRTILATEAVHPYAKNWWPPGHIIGYEHAFVHAAADFMNAVAKGAPIAPSFYDGMKLMQVLEAGLRSAEEGRRVAVD